MMVISVVLQTAARTLPHHEISDSWKTTFTVYGIEIAVVYRVCMRIALFIDVFHVRIYCEYVIKC